MGAKTADDAIAVVFWNTWLLRPRLFPRGPVLPVADRLFAPDVGRRAPLVGAALAGRFDVAALAECFNDPEQEAVLAAWEATETARGPGRSTFRNTGSGLLTVVDARRAEITYRSRLRYRAGGDLRDSDTYATKGAVLTRIRRIDGRPASGTSRRRSHEGHPEVDVVSTHLFAGGDLLSLVPGTEDRRRHHRVRMAQVDELVAFIAREHDPNLPLLVAGDFNVVAHDPDPTLDHPGLRYDDLAQRLGALGLADVWAEHGVGPGPTCTFAGPGDLVLDAKEPDRVLDDPSEAPGRAERLDYLWLAQPAGGRTVRVDRPRRWAFPRDDVRGGPAGGLSDHLALSVTLHPGQAPRP